MMFSHKIQTIPAMIDPASCDDVVFVLGHFGEDTRLIRERFAKDNATASIVVFTHDKKPRRDLCSHQSLSAALPYIEAAIKAMPEGKGRTNEALAWVPLFEGACVAMGKVAKLAGL